MNNNLVVICNKNFKTINRGYPVYSNSSNRKVPPSSLGGFVIRLRLIELCKTKLFGYIYVIGILILYYTLIYFTKEEADKVYEYLDMTTICVAKIRQIEYYVNVMVLGLMLITSGFKFNLGTIGVYSNLNEIDKKLKLLNQKLNYDKYMRDNILNITGVVISTILIGLTDYSSIKNAATYGFMLILTFITHFIGISAHLYIVYMTFGEQNYIVDLIVEFLWACFYFGKLIYIISACHSFKQEGKRASKLLHECRIDSDHNLLKQETESFARQVRNVDIKITASNLFTIDYPALWKIVLGQTAYVFFLSQFTSTK
ncbi:Protein of unknown function [Cotesia congregata]|uniref:Gustatory receptor n=1 Tax=Cotesia congregata TaxID=51543 RepID=A0A8J2HGF4_COTCN|nr:Protein of unknown function [Cotesia congregata]